MHDKTGFKELWQKEDFDFLLSRMFEQFTGNVPTLTCKHRKLPVILGSCLVLGGEPGDFKKNRVKDVLCELSISVQAAATVSTWVYAAFLGCCHMTVLCINTGKGEHGASEL